MGDIEDIHADLDADISLEEFREAVEEKVEQMGGLADEETAAMLIAHDLSENEVNGVADIEPGMEEVQFLAKVVRIGELRTFERDGEDEEGQVINVEMADESGTVTVSFWDEEAGAVADGELESGEVLRVEGRPKDGFNGIEVSATRAEPDEDAEVDVQIQDTYRIEDLSLGLSDVNLQGQVLETEPVRTFDRDDGSEGRVSNLVVGDETGRIRVTMWDERADRAEEIDPNATVEVVDGYVRERDGDLELHVGERGAIEEVDADVEYVPETTDIDEVEIGQTVDVAGVVRSADPKRTFDRDDGSEGQVKNIRVQDETGDIRVALWGEKADRDVAPGDEVVLTDVEIQDGWQDDLEASAGWRSTVSVLSESANAGGAEPSTDEPGSQSTGLDAFDGNETPESNGNADLGSGESVEFTGTVVQAGNPVILDAGDETMAVETDADVQLGQEITARGPVADGRLDAEDVF